MKVAILGAGITGRLAALVLQSEDVHLFESKPKEIADRLTRNFGANYLWEPIGLEEGLELRQFKVFTKIDNESPCEQSIRRYKSKVGKAYETSRDWGEQFNEETDGWDIVKFPDVPIYYEHQVMEVRFEDRYVVYNNGSGGVFQMGYDLLLSTIPLPYLVRLTGLEYMYPFESWFKHSPIYVATSKQAIEDPDNIYVNYHSDFSDPVYRTTWRDGLVHTESLVVPEGQTYHKIYPGKIYPADGIQDLHEYLGRYGIVCFGRFAEWNPDELVHHSYQKLKEMHHG